MKNEKKMPPVAKSKKKGTGSNPVNKFKEGKTTSAAAINNITKGSVGNVKAGSGKDVRGSSGLTNTGPFVSYEDQEGLWFLIIIEKHLMKKLSSK